MIVEQCWKQKFTHPDGIDVAAAGARLVEIAKMATIMSQLPVYCQVSSLNQSQRSAPPSPLAKIHRP